MRESLRQLFKSKPRKILGVIFVLGLLYLILPGPRRIEDFPPLPASVKSTLEGDTIQNPNIAAYYSDFRRYFITYFYKKEFAKMYTFGAVFPPVTVNHRPEDAYRYIRDQQASTFLEEYVYPLRESFFVNGYDPLMANIMYKHQTSNVGNHILVRDQITEEEKLYDSKTTVRFYPTSPLWRITIYFLIWFSGLGIYRLFIKALKET